jgi:hypothetical protein
VHIFGTFNPEPEGDGRRERLETPRPSPSGSGLNDDVVNDDLAAPEDRIRKRESGTFVIKASQNPM